MVLDMSGLIFVRDGRTLSYIPVTCVALDAIRGETTRERLAAQKLAAATGDGEPGVARPYVLGTYMALLEAANSARSARAEVSQRHLATVVGTSRATIQRALQTLIRARVVEVLTRTHAGQRVESEYVIVEPAETEHKMHPGLATSPGVDSPLVQGGLVASQQLTTRRTTRRTEEELPRASVAEEEPTGEPIDPGSMKAARVNGVAVSEQEESLATRVIIAFNDVAGTRYTVSAHRTKIIGRLREHPELMGDDHEEIIRHNFEMPWWREGKPSPAVIYGSAETFERAMHCDGKPRPVAGTRGAPVPERFLKYDQFTQKG